MPITRLEFASIWDRPPNVAGAQCFGNVDRIGSWEYQRRRDGSHVATITAPLSGNLATLADQRRVLALHFAAATPGGLGEVHPLRISETTRTQSGEGLEVRVVARSLLFDLTDAGPLSYVYAGGSHAFAVSAELTVSDWATQYLQPHLARQGYGYVQITGGPALKVPHAATRQSALEILNALQAYVGYELQVTPAGGTIAVDLVQRVNAALPPLRIAVGRNVQRIAQTRASIEQATVLVPFGGQGHSELSQSIQSMLFQSTNTDYGLKETDLTHFNDSAWLFPVVAQDGQWVDASAQRTWYLQRVKTGRCFPITASWANGGAGRVRLADLTNLANLPGSDLWSLREGRTPGTELDVPTPGTPLRVSGAPAGTVVTLVNPFTGGDPVPTDDVHLDCKVRRSTLVLATTASSVAAVAGSTTDVDVTVASTSGVQVGDWGFAHDNAAPPWSLFGKVFRVVQVVSATVLRVRVRYTFDSGLPFSAGAMVKQLSVYRVATSFLAFVNDESAAANTITLDTATGLAANDLVEYVLENSGATVTGLPSPLVAQYGVARKAQTFASARCLPNLALAANPVFDAYTTAAGQPPDGYTVSGAGTVTKQTTNLPGPGLFHAVTIRAASSLYHLISPVIYVRPTDGNSKVSARVRLRTEIWSGVNAHECVVSLRVGNGTTILGSTTIVPPNYGGPIIGATVVQPNTIVDVDVVAADVLHTPGAGARYAPWDGVQVWVTSSSSGVSGAPQVTIGGIFVVQDAALPPSPWMGRYGNQDLVGLGQLALQELEAPETTNLLDAFDLSRALGEQYPAEELVEGRSVLLEAEALGLSVEDRIEAVTYRGQPDGGTEVRVATRTTRFADVLANYLTATTPGA